MKSQGLRLALLLFLLAILAALLFWPKAVSRPVAESDVVKSQAHSFRAVTVVRGLAHPWSLAFLPDGRWLVTERAGRLRVVEDGRLLPQPVAGLPPIRQHGQGGLLDIALHPGYANNGWIYLSYAGEGPGGVGTELLRGRLDGNRLVDVEILFRMQPKRTTELHFGGRLVFDRSGHLYLTLGDRGQMQEAQRLDNHQGGIVRLLDDGRVPRDNPFVGRRNALAEIWSYGHRNVQGAALHPVSGRLWTHEHGPQGGDEINVPGPGVNHGWPVITYGVNYGSGTPIGEGTHKPGMAQPVYQWTPSIAPSGMAFYQGDRFPRWRGNLLVGALKYRMLVRLTLEGDKVIAEERLLEGIDRIRDVRVGPDGLVYLLTDEQDGRIIRLEPVK